MKRIHNEQDSGPWARGAADSYYGRAKHPHYYDGPLYNSNVVMAEGMTPAEIEAYYAGYHWNEMNNPKRSWG